MPASHLTALMKTLTMTRSMTYGGLTISTRLQTSLLIAAPLQAQPMAGPKKGKARG